MIQYVLFCHRSFMRTPLLKNTFLKKKKSKMSLSLVGIQLDVIDAQCVTDVKLNVQRAVAYIENLVSTLCFDQKPILFVFPEMTTIGYEITGGIKYKFENISIKLRN